VDTTGNDTCKGDLCYVTRQLDSFFKYGTERGCITNNETLFAGLYQVGSMKSVNLEIAVCNATLCNADVSSAKKNLPVLTTTSALTTTTTMPTTTALLTTTRATTTSTPATTTKAAIRESEFERLLRKITSAFEQLFTGFT
ncbi:hypothetical protein PENTCL1PPCAC_14089, partial [Pristionchus entomophagus]